jgi:hypothetical protein
MLVAVVGYVFMDRQLHATQLARFADAQRGGAKAFERNGERANSHSEAIMGSHATQFASMARLRDWRTTELSRWLS